MADYPITDPTLADFHKLLSPHERIYFGSALDSETHEERLIRVVSPVVVIPAPLVIDIHYVEETSEDED